jgi:NAD(P)-dependent dehydrogenase (short-subunit alcohol dehydrogenase family)
VALVTGGSHGIGKSMAEAFAAAGADVVIASRKLENCQKLADEINERFGRQALGVACNVSEWPQCERLAETAYARFGHIDVLVNNAGMSPLYPSLDQVSEDLWDTVIGLNLKGLFRLTALIGTPGWQPRAAARSSTSVRWPPSVRSLDICPTPHPMLASTR